METVPGWESDSMGSREGPCVISAYTGGWTTLCHRQTPVAWCGSPGFHVASTG